MPEKEQKNSDFPEQAFPFPELKNRLATFEQEIKVVQTRPYSQEIQKVLYEKEQKLLKLKQELQYLVDANLQVLEKRVTAFTGKELQKFENSLKKIELQLGELETSYAQIFSLKKHIVAGTNPKIATDINKQFPVSSPWANEGRMKSYESIAGIKPEPDQSAFVNWLAWWIERLHLSS